MIVAIVLCVICYYYSSIYIASTQIFILYDVVYLCAAT